LPNETLIYDLKIDKAYCLNQTSALVWSECDGTNTAADISRNISPKLGAAVSEDIVWLALSQFKKDGLLDGNEQLVTPLDGLSRREIVKRVGFASVVALPIISAMVAPKAAWAQSACISPGPQTGCVPGNGNDLSPAGCPCTGNPECAGVCPVGPPGARFCAGGPPVGPFCAPGNVNDLSADCCPCTGNPECAGVCPVGPPGQRFCVGGGF
jgi:hypothetical protein